MMKDVETIDVPGNDTVSVISNHGNPTYCVINENRVLGNKVLKYKNTWITATLYVYDSVVHRDDGPAIIWTNTYIDNRQLYDFYYQGVRYTLSDYVDLVSKIDMPLASMVLLTYG